MYKAITDQQLEDMKVYAELGVSYNQIAEDMHLSPHTVSKYLGKKLERHKIDNTVIQQLEELQAKGLSHSQIAIETGISRNTINKYLGKQKAGSRASWASISAHATGSSFVYEKKEEQETKLGKETMDKKDTQTPQKLKIVKTSVSLEGDDFSYRAESDGRIRVTSKTGVAIDLNKEQLISLIAELCEVQNWLLANYKA